MKTILGIGLSLLALVLSALGSILTKRISPHLDKLHISGYIGASIFAFGLVAFYTDDLILGVGGGAASANLTSMANFSNFFSPNETDFGKTNLTCLIGQMNSTSFDSNGTDFEAVLDTCALPDPPYLPSNVDVWCMAIVVAVLGIAQQFCLIGKKVG